MALDMAAGRVEPARVPVLLAELVRSGVAAMLAEEVLTADAETSARRLTMLEAEAELIRAALRARDWSRARQVGATAAATLRVPAGQLADAPWQSRGHLRAAPDALVEAAARRRRYRRPATCPGRPEGSTVEPTTCRT